MSPTTASVKPTQTTTKITSIKTLAESADLTAVPSAYAFTTNPEDLADPTDPEFAIPVFDFFALTSSSPSERSELLRDLATVCQDWGFFIVKNHGVPESVMKGMIESCYEFFQLPEEKKQRLETNYVLDPVKYGTSYNIGLDKFLLWRDYVKVRVHPEFHALDEPVSFSEISREFGKRTREVAMGLIRAISESLGLEADYVHKKMNLDQGLQMIATNYYPPCPQPDLAIGIPHHTDHGLLTLLIENDISGLQVEHNGKWLSVNNHIPNAFFVNLADHMQILSNGKYKSVMHRASVNNRATRISIAIPHGPSLDTVVEPSPELLRREGQPPKYKAMNYREYVELQQSGKSYMKSPLDHIRII